MEWQEDTLIVGYPNQRGWDVMLCGRNGLTYLLNAKIQPSDRKPVDVMSQDLKEAVNDQVPACLSPEVESDFFQRLHFVLWVPAHVGAAAGAKPSLEEMVNYVEKRCAAKRKQVLEQTEGANEQEAQKKLEEWERALRYVKLCYAENVVVLGGEDIQAIMPPVLQPIAALVRRVTGSSA